MLKNTTYFFLFIITCVCGLTANAQTFPTRPADGIFISDNAEMVSPEVEKDIGDIASNLWNDLKIPIIVVTIESLEKYSGGKPIDIETYSRKLFNDWGIGYKVHNYGILLLVSKEDQQARIQFSSGWGYLYDEQAEAILHGSVIPLFQESRYSEGVYEGTKALDNLARTSLSFHVDQSKVIITIFCFIVAYSLVMWWAFSTYGDHRWKLFSRFSITLTILCLATFIAHECGELNLIELLTAFAAYAGIVMFSVAAYTIYYYRRHGLTSAFWTLLLLIFVLPLGPIILMSLLLNFFGSNSEYGDGNADYGGGATADWD